MRLHSIAVITFAALLLASLARAQADFGALDIHPGDQIYVTQPSGVEVGGRLTRIPPVMLEINGYQFEPEPARSPRVAPLVTSTRKGAALTFTF